MLQSSGTSASFKARQPQIRGRSLTARINSAHCRRCLVYACSNGKAAPLKVMISGAPAAGKGTQCTKIVQKYGLVHVSVGDLLREQVSKGTPAGLKAKSYMEKGVLVPDEVVVDMVKSRLAQNDVQERGWLVDGYPRSASQAEAIEKEHIRPDVFILIDVPSDILIDRVVGRRMDPETGEIYHLKYRPPPEHVAGRLQQRFDDTEEKARTRLETHFNNVDAVLGFYSDVIVHVDGDRSMDDVFNSVCDAIDKARDPLETYCKSRPEADECRVYDD